MVDPELLVEVPMFQTLPLEERKRLAGVMKEEILPAGRILFEVGDPGTSMYIVVKGKIRISIAGDSGEEVQLAALGGGEFFGELALLDQNPRSARATAIEETVLYELGRESFLAFVGSRPDAALSMLSATAKRLRHTDELMRSRAAFDVNEEFKKHDTASGRWAENMANAMGSWTFVGGLLCFSGIWTILIMIFAMTFDDAQSLGRLGLILGFVQTFSGPIIMMGQNRDQTRGRIQADADFKVNLKNEVALDKALERLDEVRRQLPDLRRQVKEAETLSRKQYENLKKQLVAKRAAPPAPPPPSATTPTDGTPAVGSGAQPIGYDEEIPGEGTAVFMRPLGLSDPAPAVRVSSPPPRPSPDEDEADDAGVVEEMAAVSGAPVDDAPPAGGDTVKTGLSDALKRFRAQTK